MNAPARTTPATPILRNDMTQARHSWNEKVEFAHKSERECANGCGIVKVTRHESGRHWVEFWRDCERIPGDKTPACEPVGVSA